MNGKESSVRLVNFAFVSMMCIASNLMAEENTNAGAMGVKPVGLKQVYDTAVKSDPQLRAAIDRLQAATEVKKQGRGALLPRLDGSISWDTNSRDILEGGTPDAKTDYASTTYALSLTQPIFRKNLWEVTKQGRLGENIEQLSYTAAEQELIVRVLTRYFGVLASVDNLEFAKAEKTAVARQLDQVKKRFDVGMIAITDVQESQARYDLTVAQQIAAENQLSLSMEALREVTGESYANLRPLGGTMPLQAPEPGMDEWVNTAFEKNPAMRIAHLNLELAQSRIRQQRTGYLPTVDLVGRYVRNHDEGSPIFQETESTVLGVQAGINFYEGGQTQARIREAVQRYSETQENLEKQKRTAQRDTRAAFLNAQASISQTNALAQALKSSETALKATEAGFEVGTRTSVDILNSQQDLFRAKRDYAKARYDYILNLMLLKQSAGVLAAEDIARVETWLQ